MKKISTILSAIILTVSLLAQVPQTMSYQAVIRDIDNNLIANQTVGMQLSILHGSISGTVVYSETLTTTTNDNGLISIEFGNEAGFGAIDWADGPYFIKTETDPEGNTNYTITGTSQLLSVPYALHAKSAETISQAIIENDPVFIAWDKSEGILITESQITDLQDYISSETFDLENAIPGDLLQFDGEKWVKVTPDFKTIIVSGTDIIVTGEGTSNMPYVINTTSGATPGEMRYWDGSDWVAIPPGETGQTLTFCNGVPTWGLCTGNATVNILGVSNITDTKATINIHVVSDGGTEVTERGVAYSTEQNPTISDNFVLGGSGIGSFTLEISGLLPQTTYYVRAFATNSEGTSYSSQVIITTSNISYGSVTDADNNVYNTVVIGNQEWMAENLKTTKYRDGTNIPNTTNNEAWLELSSGAYAFYENTSLRGDQYGALYNWYAVEDSRELCPTGWRVPTDTDWNQLRDYIVNNSEFAVFDLGKSLKSCRQVSSPLGEECATNDHPRWAYYETNNGTDNFGFSALPGGVRETEGPYSGVGFYSFWWSSSADGADNALVRSVNRETSGFMNYSRSKKYGFSVRCVRDQ